ncbi:hypothetical protein OOK44_28960 [Streptomyces cellulosae]|jgi:hypothetical protein|uniref:Uncharacterized protein n=2 Tax=Streptomyces TaxID=1883 RepID=A0ABU3J877_9ACTN|nr:hypothetical protein [Streptomyces sp. McG7]MBT2903088.1 hypothetical protein [Streptomyces sp. McG8]MCP8708433.1 hypothetical protein [Streptomyces sp. AC04842]MCX4480424.1 hypothetical protein [Streptomyces cellulosae]MDN3284950.1 hypothetical protein [Streptomyces thermocarboxydus]MXQ60993.1 hypothetical protein [Streptomyces sp. XHT-2]MYQ31912.1 hypothetical protein [Streptomyces sp. SID4956]MYW54199.1 hypothetical protein [Streptomyces sp. SID8376]
MPEALFDSQLATLSNPDERGIGLDAASAPSVTPRTALEQASPAPPPERFLTHPL